MKRESVIINKVTDGIDPLLKAEMERLGLAPTTTIPVDEELLSFDLEQKSFADLPDTAKAVSAVDNLMDKLFRPEEAQIKRG